MKIKKRNLKNKRKNKNPFRMFHLKSKRGVCGDRNLEVWILTDSIEALAFE